MIKQIYKFLNPRFQNLFLEYKLDFKPRYGHGNPAHSELLKIIDSNRTKYKELLYKALSHKDFIWSIQDAGTETDSDRPTWNNGYLPGLDIIGLYMMLATYKPKRYIEIGSGNSTKVAFKAKAEQGLTTEIMSVDPVPRAEIDKLADKVIRKPIEDIDLAILGELERNDILFVDNSHRILPNSDSLVFFLEILPRLNKGVIIQVHDIYLPYDYPQFMCDRYYSEQYGLAMFLLANPGKYETLLPNYYISEDKELSGLLSPIWENKSLEGVERHGGSYWFRING